MDCSICMDAITKQTGVVTLSCEHSFHFRCIDEWFYKQAVASDKQTCPCCRNEGTGLDRGAFEVNEDDESDESESEYGSEYESEYEDEEENELANLLLGQDWTLERNVSTGQLVFTPSVDIALERVRSMFGAANDLDQPTEDMAARKIQAIYRGYRARTAFENQQAARTLMRLFFQAYSL